MVDALKASLICAAALACASPVRAEAPPQPQSSAQLPSSTQPPVWPDTFVARVEALATLESLNADLLSHDSATLTLERWCDAHRLASPARVVAQPESLDKAPSADQRRELGIGPAEAVRYRRVRLICGSTLLSEADNWYVPSRLTAEMNERLTRSDVPFGKVVQALHFQRRTLSSTLLWRPLPEGWDMAQATGGDGTRTLVMPHAVLEHRALLTLPDGTPISEVVETYTNGVLAFPPPRP